MKNFLFVIAIAVIAALPDHVLGQTTIDNATASATIVTALSLSEDAGHMLNFGSLVSTNTAGTCILSASETAGRIGTNVVLIEGTTGYSSGKFKVVGLNGAGYTVTLPSGSIDVENEEDEGNTMSVSNFTCSTIIQLPASGTNDFYVGATLAVDAGQESGEYTGTYNVTVAYN